MKEEGEKMRRNFITNNLRYKYIIDKSIAYNVILVNNEHFLQSLNL